MPRDYLSVLDLTAEETRAVLTLAATLKRERGSAAAARPLAGKSVALLFEKPSLRTRVSFDVGIAELGGHPLYLGPDEVGLGKREAVADVGQVLGRYVQAIVARVFHHADIERLAASTETPVINALSDREHPCQALADLFTLWERKGRLDGLHVAFLGDVANNVSTSLMLLSARLGVRVTLIGPPGFPPDRHQVELARLQGGGAVAVSPSLADAALDGIDALYTDVWVSMGHEAEAEERKASMRPYQVNGALLKRAGSDTVVLHCLPAHRGEEVTDDVLDGPQSAVWDQAENRLHVQKALLTWLGEQGSSPPSRIRPGAQR